MKKLIVDENVCIGCGFCCASNPEVFDMNDEDRAYTKETIDMETAQNKEELNDIMEGCPVGAIQTEEE